MKNVSINQWEKLMSEHKKVVTDKICNRASETDEDGIEIEVKIGLSVEDRMRFAQEVSLASFDVMDGQYVPYAFKISWNLYLIKYFTNITISKDYDKMMTFIEDTNVIEVITRHNLKLVNDLLGDVEDLIEYEKDKHAKGAKADELYEALLNIISGLTDSFDELLTGDDLENVGEFLTKLKSKEDNVGD